MGLWCGIRTIYLWHPRPCIKQLEIQLSEFLGTEDTILYPSCFDANGGLFETLLGAEDAVISDDLITPALSMVCVCVRLHVTVMRNNDMADLEATATSG